jgi:hypothetical protein
MNMRTFCWNQAFSVAAGLSALSFMPAAAQTNESGPTIEARVQTFKQTGGVSISAWGNTVSVPGTPATFFLTAGSVNPAEMTVCGGGFGESGSTADKLSRNSFVWELKILPVKNENASSTFNLEWARYQADIGGRPAAEGKSTLTLREGERQTIDLVRGAEGSRCSDESAVVDVAAGYKEGRSVAHAILQYDIWLKHQPATGGAVIRKFTAMGAQGSDVRFGFVPLVFSVPQLAPGQGAYDVLTTVQGVVKGRLQPNGRIALIVDTTRRDGLDPRGAGGTGGSSGNSGRKTLDIGPDETIEIELPLPGGRSSVPSAGSAMATPRGAVPRTAPKDAVSIVDGRLVVENALFFQGQAHVADREGEADQPVAPRMKAAVGCGDVLS